MDGFTFTDIFDTKGIEYLVIIGFLLLAIPFWIWLNRPVKMRPAGVPGTLSRRDLRIPQGLFFNRNHTWAFLEPSGMARVGLDDLLLKLTGDVKIDYLVDPMAYVRRGEPIVRIVRDGKHLDIASPLTGHVEYIHTSLNSDGELLLEDPYGEGWLCKLTPERWSDETRSGYLAEEATRWIVQELASVRDFIMQSLQGRSPDNQALLVLQEGGELTGYPLSEMDADVWQDFQQKFLDRT